MSRSKNLLLVHGIFDNGGIFANFSTALTRHGYRTSSITMARSYGLSGIEGLAGQLKTFIDENLPADESTSLIGFSMGGIVSRHYLQRLGGMDRVDKLITICSPHHGTLAGYLWPLKGSLQLRLGSGYLKELNSDMESLERVSPVSLWTRYDEMIIPQRSAILGIGEAIHIPLFPHRRMATNNRVVSSILDCLD